MSAFTDKLRTASRRNASMLCIGLDPDPKLMPPGVPVATFLCDIVEATKDLVCAYKPNFAFFEALGIDGWKALQEVMRMMPKDVVSIADAKRGDIGNTSAAYAKAIFEVWGFDATTVAPYMGSDSVQPFLDYTNKGVLLLCRTSNKGGADFQDLTAGGKPLYEQVALKARAWNVKGNIGLVVGATQPSELKRVRELCPDMPILVPGVGAQGGDLAGSVKAGLDNTGGGIIVSSSREVLYASKGKDYAQASRKVAERVRSEIARAAGL